MAHSCHYCGQACYCDGEDMWWDEADNCFHDCDPPPHDDYLEDYREEPRMEAMPFPVTPDRLREMAQEITCQCSVHVQMAADLRAMADRLESTPESDSAASSTQPEQENRDE